MLIPTIVEVIEIVIFTFTIIFCIKNYLIELKESNNSFKNILLMTLSVILAISSALSIFYSIDLSGILTRLATEINQMSIELVEMLNHQKFQLEQIIIVLGILQGISLLMLTILFRNIKKEIKETYNTNSKNHWDWDKIRYI